MGDPRTHDHVVALAGIFQAVKLVQQVAREGSAEPGAFEASIASLFRVDAESADEIFGTGIECGLRTLSRQLGDDKSQRDPELTGYAVRLLFLERKLSRDARLMDVVRSGIDAASQQARHFPLTHENVLARLAEIYSSTVSTIQPRIMVQGQPEHLANPANANRIRALLLAGIRAAVLWRQLGGSRLRLLLSRRRLVDCAQAMLSEACA